MSTSFIDAKEVDKEKQKEQEFLKAEVKADIAVVLPVFPENEVSDIQIELDYDTITKAINDYIERYTIDPRINEIEYELSTPNLPDEKATNNLKEVLTGETDEITTSNDIIQVDNNAINDEKVILKFELSVEETVYLDENGEIVPQENGGPLSKNSSLQKTSVSPSTKSSQPIYNQPKKELVIQSTQPQLYWQNAPSAQLYWQNAPSNDFQSTNSSYLVENSLDTIGSMGSGMDEAMGSIGTIEEMGGYLKLGNNGRVYTNPQARGGKYYKIVGNVSDSKLVKRLGTAGKILSYGTTVIQTGIDYSQAETPQEKGRIVGASVGKVTSGIAAGTVASTITTAALISIATVAGVATAPVTLVVVAGCSIIASVMAANAVEKYGEDIGGNVGEMTVDYLKNKTKK